MQNTEKSARARVIADLREEARAEQTAAGKKFNRTACRGKNSTGKTRKMQKDENRLGRGVDLRGVEKSRRPVTRETARVSPEPFLSSRLELPRQKIVALLNISLQNRTAKLRSFAVVCAALCVYCR